MSLSPDSAVANSSLTDCGNSASDCGSVVSATCKRKRDCDSDMPLLSDMNLPLLFHHIIMARYNLPPYQDCSDSWDDEVIWSKIAVAMRPSVVDVLDYVTYYGKLYRDGRLCYVTDEFLRANVCVVFEENPFKVSKGCINLEEICSMKKVVKAKQPPRRLHKTDVHLKTQLYHDSSSSECVPPTYAADFSGRNRIIERVQKEKRQREKEKGQVQNQLVPHPCTSNQLSYPGLQNMIGYNVCKELGYHGSIAVRYSEDLNCLNLDHSKTHSLLQKYGPLSEQYLAISGNPQEKRLKVLEMFLTDILNDLGYNSSKSSVKSRMKKEVRNSK